MGKPGAQPSGRPAQDTAARQTAAARRECCRLGYHAAFSREACTRVTDTLTEEVIAIIAKEQRLAPAVISPDATFQELKIDSLDGVNIVFALEEKYNITIPDQVAREMRSIRQVVVALRTQLDAASA